MLVRNAGTYTTKKRRSIIASVRNVLRMETLRSRLHAPLRQTCLPNASHGLTSRTPPLNKTYLRQQVTTKPSLLQPGMENIYTNKEIVGASLWKGEGKWNRYHAVYERTLVEILQQMIFRPKYYLKVQSTSFEIGAPTLKGPKLNCVKKIHHEKLNWIFSATAQVSHQVWRFFGQFCWVPWTDVIVMSETEETVRFLEWTANFSVWKTTGKDSSEACATACQNCAVYSVFTLGMISHSTIISVYRALNTISFRKLY
jgi:hypothetical protein